MADQVGTVGQARSAEPLNAPTRAADFDRELALVALTGWEHLPAGQAHHLAALAAGVDQLDRLVAAPGCSLLPDQRVLLATGSTDTTIRLWEPATGRELHRTALPRDVPGICVTPDGELAVCHGNEVAVMCLTITPAR